MLTTGKGNCYNFAAVFCELARFIGYDAQVYSGYVKGPGALDENGDVLWVAERPHAWVEIVIKGEARLFDPELAHSYLGQSDANFFNRGQGVRRQFNYHV